ncbi:hypothetical protein TNCV_730611 [Trichonephila clavipes]|nr:hypothetical protein TNCV_730611 [Trichonephila clavipes]
MEVHEIHRGKGLNIPPYRTGIKHLQKSIPSPGFEPRPYSTVVSVTNHCIGSAAKGVWREKLEFGLGG